MERKYELTDEKIEVDGHILHRIIALRDFSNEFGNVKKGDLGGFIEKESNLSHEGTCWVYGYAYENAEVLDDANVCKGACVYGDADVFGKAVVYDFAEVYGDAMVCGNAKVKDFAKVFGNARVSGDTVIKDEKMNRKEKE